MIRPNKRTVSMDIILVYNAVIKAEMLYEVLLTAKLPTSNLKDFNINSLTLKEQQKFIFSALDWDVI